MRGPGGTGLTLLLIAMALPPAAEAAVDRPAVHAMLETSGIVEEYSGVGDALRDGITKGAAVLDMPQQVVDELGKITSRSGASEKFLDDVEATLADKLAPADTEAVVAFYASELGQRVRDAEVAGSSAEAVSEIEAHRPELGATLRGDQVRAAVIKRIDAALKASELSVAMSECVEYVLLVGGIVDEERQVTPALLDELKRHERMMRLNDVQRARVATAAALAYVYRDLSTSELAAYADFLESGPAQAFRSTFLDAASGFYDSIGRKIGEDFSVFVASGSP